MSRSGLAVAPVTMHHRPSCSVVSCAVIVALSCGACAASQQQSHGDGSDTTGSAGAASQDHGADDPCDVTDFTSRPEVTGRELAGCNLTGSDLRGAFLQDANLTGAYMASANLTMANLRGANLERAFMERAYLWGADLEGADLTDAYLVGAVHLSSANVTGVTWSHTRCPDGSNSDDHGSTCENHLDP